MIEFELFNRGIFHGISPSVVERFVDYHKQNPQVFAAFKRFAYEVLKSGRTHFSGKAIAERVRFDSLVSGNDGFKLNNSFVACMVRMLQFEDKNFIGFFETREKRRAA